MINNIAQKKDQKHAVARISAKKYEREANKPPSHIQARYLGQTQRQQYHPYQDRRS